ncbi:helix-turn-helix domain-containing protein [Paenibacillus antri]|uniref:Helix-turn-helix domain-containing protein n=2 Tax=Paenibacillus antri TaxID=2582848 RepID=A0A5R9GEM8_9BACL|nr:helix-turn-helix domain-containing protein [Paenibacillus antri]
MRTRMRKTASSRWMYTNDRGEAASDVPELITLGYDRFSEAIPLPDHRHDRSYEFVYMESGRATWEVGGASYASHAGQLFHTRPGEVHRARSNHIEPCSIWWMIVLDPAETKGWLRLEERERVTLADALREAPRVATIGPGALEPLRRMRLVLEQGGALRALEIRTGIVDLLLRALRPGKSPDLPPDLSEALVKLCARIQAEPERRWTTAELASTLGVGDSHVYRVFREAVGQSPASYIERVRVERACERLTRTDVSVTEVAFELGFKTSQHFATVFKRYTGLTPTQWRHHSRPQTL